MVNDRLCPKFDHDWLLTIVAKWLNYTGCCVLSSYYIMIDNQRPWMAMNQFGKVGMISIDRSRMDSHLEVTWFYFMTKNINFILSNLCWISSLKACFAFKRPVSKFEMIRQCILSLWHFIFRSAHFTVQKVKCATLWVWSIQVFLHSLRSISMMSILTPWKWIPQRFFNLSQYKIC